MPARALVVGGGAIGVASAYFLQRSGWEVTVVDRAGIGQGCSYGNACLMLPSHVEPIPGPGVVGTALRWMLSRESPFYLRPRLDPALLRWGLAFRRYCNEAALERAREALEPLSRGSVELYEELVRAGEVEFYLRRRGLLEAYVEAESVAKAPETAEELGAMGFSAKFLRGDEARSLEPALSPSVGGAVFVEGQAHGLCLGYVQSLAETVRARGGRLLAGRSVARLIGSRERVRGAELEGAEEIPADLVVLAAGAWSGELLMRLGLRLPLQPAKGYSCTVDRGPGAPSIPIMMKDRRVVVTPLGDRLRFAGTLELAGFDLSIDPVRYGAVVRGGREALATPPPMRNEEAWAGLRPVTPDGLPVIDRAAEGLIVATGHAMMGFTQSPMTGKLVAELADGGPPSVPLEPFRLRRF